MRLLRHDDVQAGEVRETADEVEVGRPQTSGVRRVVGHGDHEMVERQNRLNGDQDSAKDVLVQAAARGEPALVGQERESEQPCLLDQAFAATVRTAFDRKFPEERARKPPRATQATPKLVVEVEHGRHQAGPRLEERRGRWMNRLRFNHRAAEQSLTFEV